MSNFIAKAKHPATGKLQDAFFVDDYYGSHIYGVGFRKDDIKLEITDSFEDLEFFREEEL